MSARAEAALGRYRSPAEIALLRRILVDDAPLPAPRWLESPRLDAGELVGAARRLRAAADRDGVVAVDIGRALGNGELLAFASEWGSPIAEHAPQVQPFVESDYILNIRVGWETTADVDRQPFSAAAILLHSEASRRPVAEQPRYLVFDCTEPCGPEGGGQTAFVPMRDVADRLAPEVRAILERVRYQGDRMPPLLRREGRESVFSFRDFGAEPLAWASDAALEDSDVEWALGALLRAIYDRELLSGLTWDRHLLVVIDNQRVFHGRTALRPGGNGRWVKRIRLLAPS